MSKHTNIKERVLDHTWLKSIIKYVPETGKFYWYAPRNGLAFLGKQAGSLKNKKHTAIGIAGRTYMAHRLAFFYMTGAWPKNLIDHINMNGTDNRWCNLREATSAENNFNKIIDNRQGFRGIRLNSGKWSSGICKDNECHYLGFYDTKAEAFAAYRGAAKILYGPFADTLEAISYPCSREAINQ